MVMRGVNRAIVSIASSWFSGVDPAQAGICCQSNGDTLVCSSQGGLQHRTGLSSGIPLLPPAIPPPLAETAERDNWKPLGELGGLWCEIIHGIVGGDLEFRPLVHVFHPYAFWRLQRNVSGVGRRGSGMPWRDGCSSCLSDSRPRRSRPNGTTHCG